MVTAVVNKPQKDNYWPFPTKDNPLTPWTPKEVKEYQKLQRENAQESPL
jgi:hypothetical protein